MLQLNPSQRAKAWKETMKKTERINELRLRVPVSEIETLPGAYPCFSGHKYVRPKATLGRTRTKVKESHRRSARRILNRISDAEEHIKDMGQDTYLTRLSIRHLQRDFCDGHSLLRAQELTRNVQREMLSEYDKVQATQAATSRLAEARPWATNDRASSMSRGSSRRRPRDSRGPLPAKVGGDRSPLSPLSTERSISSAGTLPGAGERGAPIWDSSVQEWRRIEDYRKPGPGGAEVLLSMPGGRPAHDTLRQGTFTRAVNRDPDPPARPRPGSEISKFAEVTRKAGISLHTRS